MVLTRVPVDAKFAVSLLLKLKLASVPVSGLLKLSCSAWNWKPTVMKCFPLVHSTLFCTSKVLAASVFT